MGGAVWGVTQMGGAACEVQANPMGEVVMGVKALVPNRGGPRGALHTGPFES